MSQRSGPRVVVTTSLKPDPTLVERARAVAAAGGGPFWPRRGGLAGWLEREDVDLLYVVSRDREQLRDGEQSLCVHEGMLKLKSKDGRAHPFLRAVAPPGAAPVDRVVDATLGLSQDALHLAMGLEAEVIGFELSPWIASLVEGGLRRIQLRSPRWAAAAARIEVRGQDAVRFLESQPEGSIPVVTLDPMFHVPQRAQPGFALLRRCAHPAPLDPRTFAAAMHAAGRRVVVKVPFEPAGPSASVLALGFNRRVCARATDYLIAEKELEAPEWEERRPGGGYPYRNARVAPAP